jgi:hypothetical protein
MDKVRKNGGKRAALILKTVEESNYCRIDGKWKRDSEKEGKDIKDVGKEEESD